MRTYIFTYSLALLLSMMFTPVVIVWAKRRNWVDLPDARKVHRTPVARLGGVALFAASLLAILPVLVIPNAVGEQFRAMGWEVMVLLLGAAVIFGLGLYDDFRRVRVRTKLGVEIGVALAVCIAGIHIRQLSILGLKDVQLGWLGCGVTVFWIVGITNAMNLIDGLDGLAAGIAAIACGVMAILSVAQGNVVLAIVMLAVLGSLTGFLFFNFHPAKIFMGDCGSLFLGFTIATASVLTATKRAALVGLALPVLVLGIPIFDTLLSILRRFLERRGIVSPDRAHLHHRLLDLGLGQRQVAILAYGVTLLLSGLGFFMLATRSAQSGVLFVAGLVLLLVVFRWAGAVKLRETLAGIRCRSEWSHQWRLERKVFEEAQLRFRDARTIEHGWQCLCRAADALGCAKVCLDLASRDESQQCLIWEKDRTSASTEDQVLRLSVPVSDPGAPQELCMEIDVLTRGSIEGAGRRAALLARLAEECGLCLLPGWAEAEGVNVSEIGQGRSGRRDRRAGRRGPEVPIPVITVTSSVSKGQGAAGNLCTTGRPWPTR